MPHSAWKLALAVLGASALFLPACAAPPDDDAEQAPSVEQAPAATVASPLTLTPPYDDPFYTPPPGFESLPHGTILRTRNVSTITLAVLSKTTQMLVRSTDSRGNPVAVVSTLIVPLTPWLLGKRPLVSYQAAIDSLGDQCNPSFQLQNGLALEMPLISTLLLNNWAVVTTDYEGPKNALYATRMGGLAVLDGIRAAEHLSGSGLNTNTPVGLWGYSGGSYVTNWAAQLYSSYTPELKVKGVAVGGTAANPKAVAQFGNGGALGGLYVAGPLGLTREYPELLPRLSPLGQSTLDRIGDMCLTDLLLAYPFGRLEDLTVADPWSDPVWNTVFDDNTTGGSAPAAPVYMYHSIVDEVSPYSEAQVLRNAWCSKGAKVKFDSLLTGEHIVLLLTGAPAAVSYLADRFLGLFPAPNNCP